MSPLYPLDKLGLARVAALQGDAARSQKWYQALLADWTDADRNLPALAESLGAVSGRRPGLQ